MYIHHRSGAIFDVQLEIQITPVHVFTSGDEAGLFINGRSQGTQKKEPLAYRFRWGGVVHEPGEVIVVIDKDSKRWSTDTVVTTGEAAAVRQSADRTTITADGEDPTFITAQIIDSKVNVVPTANNAIQLQVSSPGVIVATNNGFLEDLTTFPSTKAWSAIQAHKTTQNKSWKNRSQKYVY
ncbi:hypothetical protein V497_07444 [Pseudogymnoascus sp. VKM F-4516 (FW-969)]|nr:hypothetical protein V497_07444 [Pseudogymnoascus sp. VKM F-4516 (FW-969)]